MTTCPKCAQLEAVLASRHGGEPAVLLRELDAARSALREVRDLIERYVDVKDSGDDRPPTPNAAMQAALLIDEVLKEAT